MRLIDADVLKTILKKNINSFYYGELEFYIDQQPTIEPVERGAWVEDINCNDIVMCNACGNEAYFGLDEGTYVLFDYCPNCGAKMDAEVKQE